MSLIIIFSLEVPHVGSSTRDGTRAPLHHQASPSVSFILTLDLWLAPQI